MPVTPERAREMALALPLASEAPHFDRWLAIFAETAQDLCPPAAAAHFIDRARRIAGSLALGVAAVRRDEPWTGRKA